MTARNGEKKKQKKPKRKKIYLVVETEYRGKFFLAKHRGGAPDVHARSFSSSVLLCSVYKKFLECLYLCVFSCFWVFCSDMVRFSLCSTIFSFFLFLFYCHFLTLAREREPWMRPTKTMTFFRCRRMLHCKKTPSNCTRKEDTGWEMENYNATFSTHCVCVLSHT